MRVLLIVIFLFTLLFAAFGQNGTPTTVGLTEVQRLKDENYQLKIDKLRRELTELVKERTELLQGALRGAGIAENDWDKYEYNPLLFTFTLKPSEKPKP